MARRIANRMDLRRQAEQAERQGAMTHPVSADKDRGTARRSRSGKGAPRMCARWGIFDATMRLVTSFPYNQRAEADRRIAELNAKHPGTTYIVQKIKEPMVGSNDEDFE